MKFDVKIMQVLEGHVEIEAEDFAAAVKIAQNRFVGEGEELPDMDDCNPLQFSASPVRAASLTRSEVSVVGSKEVEDYLIHNGIPHPSRDQIDEFLFGGDKQAMYDEIVLKGYELPDVDRWFHLNEVIGEPISFAAAMMIDNALWEEEYECMELNTAKDILEPPKGICKGRIEELIQSMNTNGTVIPNDWGVTDKDVITLSKALHLTPVLQHQNNEKGCSTALNDVKDQNGHQPIKRSLDSLVQSAKDAQSSLSSHPQSPQMSRLQR